MIRLSLGQRPAFCKPNILAIAIFFCLSLTACGDQKISDEDQLKCTEAIKGEELGWKVKGFHIDEYGYLCYVMEVKDLSMSADEEAMYIYSNACQPPIKGVKIINATDGKVLGKYKKE